MLTYDSFAKALAFFSSFVKTLFRFLVDVFAVVVFGGGALEADAVCPEGNDTPASSSESLSKLINAEGAFW